MTAGNLRWRKDHLTLGGNGNPQREKFWYDGLNRMIRSNVNGVITDELTYDAAGNLLCRRALSNQSCANGATNYTYGNANRPRGAGPHAAHWAQGRAYHYDLNGNVIYDNTGNGVGRAFVYTPFNKLKKVEHSTKHGLPNTSNGTEFWYDTNRSRYKRTNRINGQAASTFYIGNVEIHFDGERLNTTSAPTQNLRYRRMIGDHLTIETYLDGRATEQSRM